MPATPAPTPDLPRAVRGWLCQALGARSEIVEVSRLPGGIAAEVARVRVRRPGGEERVVLKRYTGAWVADEPDVAAREAAALRAVAPLQLSAPSLIACDETGAVCGAPALLMTWLPGDVALPHSAEPAWLGALSAPLPALHAAVDRAVALTPYQPYTGEDRLTVPPWSAVPYAWERAIEILRGAVASHRPTLIHRDYHPCNVLWSGGDVSGVVDWTNACRGPAGVDLSHCRVNLVSLYGVDEADRFRDAYIVRTGAAHDPYWDLRCLLDMLPVDRVYAGWPALGRVDLRLDAIRKRLDDWMASLVADFGG